MTAKMFKDYRKEAYFCSKCEKFHNYLIKNKPSITHLEHYGYFTKYKSQFSQAELFKMSFKKNWQREAKKTSKEKFLIVKEGIPFKL